MCTEQLNNYDNVTAVAQHWLRALCVMLMLRVCYAWCWPTAKLTDPAVLEREVLRDGRGASAHDHRQALRQPASLPRLRQTWNADVKWSLVTVQARAWTTPWFICTCVISSTSAVFVDRYVYRHTWSVRLQTYMVAMVMDNQFQETSL